jgi:7,8-dihydropterin-6-yl-methyl-4-(beta-D-ribofuranosyl)aminobenzene 5'-phosphate synthase
MRWALLVAVLLVGLTLAAALWHSTTPEGESRNTLARLTTEATQIGLARKVELKIVYDNNAFDPELKTAWGFACYIDTGELKILFDTGGDPKILLANMDRLGITVGEIQTIVLSHIHGDHVGGLPGILRENSRVDVYVPASFSDDFKSRVKAYGSNVIEVHGALKICEGVMTTGELGSGIIEQSLIVNSERGLVVVTGCAHPGIANIVETAIRLTNKDVYLVVGGFHLSGATNKEILSVVERLQSLGVTNVAPCHCSGDLARRIFKDSFGDGYVDAGAGTIIRIEPKPGLAACQASNLRVDSCRLRRSSADPMLGHHLARLFKPARSIGQGILP